MDERYKWGNLSTLRKTYPSITLCTTNPIWAGIDLEPVIVLSVAQNICVLKEPDVVIVLPSEGLVYLKEILKNKKEFGIILSKNFYG